MIKHFDGNLAYFCRFMRFIICERVSLDNLEKSKIGRYLILVLITDDFKFIIIFCGWQGPTLGGGAFFVRMVINYYDRQEGRDDAGVEVGEDDVQEGRGKTNSNVKRMRELTVLLGIRREQIFGSFRTMILQFKKNI